MREVFLEFLNFRRNHNGAVTGVGVVVEVVLMVVLGGTVVGKLCDFGDDGVVPEIGCIGFLEGRFGNRFLLFVVVEDGGSVLGSNVGALAV